MGDEVRNWWSGLRGRKADFEKHVVPVEHPGSDLDLKSAIESAVEESNKESPVIVLTRKKKVEGCTLYRTDSEYSLSSFSSDPVYLDGVQEEMNLEENFNLLSMQMDPDVAWPESTVEAYKWLRKDRTKMQIFGEAPKSRRKRVNWILFHFTLAAYTPMERESSYIWTHVIEQITMQTTEENRAWSVFLPTNEEEEIRNFYKKHKNFYLGLNETRALLELFFRLKIKKIISPALIVDGTDFPSHLFGKLAQERYQNLKKYVDEAHVRLMLNYIRFPLETPCFMKPTKKRKYISLSIDEEDDGTPKTNKFDIDLMPPCVSHIYEECRQTHHHPVDQSRVTLMKILSGLPLSDTAIYSLWNAFLDLDSEDNSHVANFPKYWIENRMKYKDISCKSVMTSIYRDRAGKERSMCPFVETVNATDIESLDLNCRKECTNVLNKKRRDERIRKKPIFSPKDFYKCCNPIQ